MALPTAYLTSAKNLESILNALKTAKAPDVFNQKFLESLEFKSSSDRLITGVLKNLKFLSDDGRPTQRYFEFLDQTQSARVIADGVRDSYADLFAVNIKANLLGREDLINKFRTLSQGQLTDSVLDKMALTFTSLVKFGDFDASKAPAKPEEAEKKDEAKTEEDSSTKASAGHAAKKGISGLVYNIELVLPESRDPAVYDALFKSLKEHLL
jgi:hypothetical protein